MRLMQTADPLHTRGEDMRRKLQREESGLTGVMMTVEMMSWYLRVCSISSTRRAGRMSVAMSVVNSDTIMPDAVISSGNDIATCAWAISLAPILCAVRSNDQQVCQPRPHKRLTCVLHAPHLEAFSSPI